MHTRTVNEVRWCYARPFEKNNTAIMSAATSGGGVVFSKTDDSGLNTWAYANWVDAGVGCYRCVGLEGMKSIGPF